MRTSVRSGFGTVIDRIGFTALVVTGVTMLTAGKGPCDDFRTAGFQNTIACAGGNCTGGVMIITHLKQCSGGEENCPDVWQDDIITFNPKADYLGSATVITCLGGTGLCALCVAAAAAVCFDPLTLIGCAVTAGGCGFVCGAIGSPDACCWTACNQDLTTRAANRIKGC